ncbi:MAG: ChbG/HpnK family deacetylase, partial [Promethearchaeota archaeon]
MMLIENLGFETTDKVVILHIDDVGFSHASNVATFECLDFGVASCGSAIVPAPWFLETASICRKNPSYDIGVHITLTCEYELYRWRALSSIDPKTGLLDSERSLWRTTEEAIGHITTQAAELEMRTQVQMAIDNGIDVTHVDTHMGTVMAPKFLPSYLKIAREFNVPAFLPRISRTDLEARGLGSLADFYLKLLDNLEKRGTFLIDNIITETMGDSPNKTEYYCKMLKELKPGITHFL